jgi:serine/threonine protein kinase
LTIPQLIDQAKPEAENSGEYFIVIEKAAGIDLDFLVKLNHSDTLEIEKLGQNFSKEEVHLLLNLHANKKLPEELLLKCIEAVIVLLEEIHQYPVDLDGVEKGGVLWNDVKPEHIFWDPAGKQCTVIDWGNAQFLELDGTTRDRLHSASDDDQQFLDSIGKFVKANAPALYEEIEWPEGKIDAGSAYGAIRTICEKIEQKLVHYQLEVTKLKEKESDLVNATHSRLSVVRDLEKIQQQLFAAGELPDYQGAGQVAEKLAQKLLEDRDLSEFDWLANWAAYLPLENWQQWRLLSMLSKIGMSYPEDLQPAFMIAIESGLQGQADDILWNLLNQTDASSLPPWFRDLSKLIRMVQLDLRPDTLTPVERVIKFSDLIETQLTPGRASSQEQDSLFINPSVFIGMNEKNRKLTEWLGRIRVEILPRWQQAEPTPPHSSLEYGDIDAIISEIGAIFPEAGQYLERTIYQPKAQARIILDAWERKDFEFSIRGMHRLLIWDPERLRIIHAGTLISETQFWLDKLANGPQRGERLVNYATRQEVFARELRSRIGPAQWLTHLLNAFRSLRQGKSQAQVVQEDPGILAELPWLGIHTAAAFPSQKPVEKDGNTLELVEEYSLDRKPKKKNKDQYLQGTVETRYGVDGELFLGEPLDLWTPEAQGSSARVYQGFVKNNDNGLVQRAVKIMRSDQRDYALPLFEEEIRILRVLNDFPGVTPVFEFGFLKPDADTDPDTPDFLDLVNDPAGGSLLRFGWDAVDEYLHEIGERTQTGWLPYLVIEKKPDEANLLVMCDGGYTRGNLIPVRLGLLIAIQICDILVQAHRQQVLYRDHKILHYYWQSVYNGVFVIDWNVAKIFDRDLTQSEKQFDLVQFGARALHHILTGRPAPGALPLGPTRPDEIEHASTQYNVSWSFDDQRLSDQVKEIIENTLAGSYSQAALLRNDLLQAFHQTREDLAGNGS